MIQKRHLLITLLLFSYYVEAQLTYGKIPDSLLAKNYNYLNKAIQKHKNDKAKSLLYAQTWLRKSEANNDFEQVALAYKSILYLSDKSTWTAYADSMLVAAKQTKNDLTIGAAYMTKATVYYGENDNKKALDNFLLADEYIAKTEDSYSMYKVKFGIAQTKYYLGFYDEAISLFKECIEYFKEENDRAYLNSIHGLGVCYNKIGKYDLSSVTNQLGIKEGRKLENLEMEPYFIHSEGINQYFRNNYQKAISDLNTALPSIKNNKDFANETVAYFYLGKCFWSIREQEKGIEYFKKVDIAFEQQKYIRPDLRESYELLIDYFKKQGDIKSQLYYINQLLKVDNVLGTNYKYLLRKVVKEYDTKELLKSKQDIENAMTFRVVIDFTIIVIMAVIIAYLIYRHFKNKRLFEEIMKRDTSKSNIQKNNYDQQLVIDTTLDKIEKTIVPENTDKQNSQEISPEFEAGILKMLEKFEQGKKYLEKDMTLTKMALLLNTNNKYVTKIISKHRGKGSIDYITDLKTDYIIEMLKTDSKFRNYTNKALGEEAGFGSTQNFSRAFKARTGITPTYFIYKLKKSIAADSSQ
ncbi:AraC family transcriptional regulator [Flavobacterium sp.]|uniref:AraC family transcriptional regulator n=2 Tax=Flavobacterium sp. TaxID=239 RepID=UPI002FDB2299